jgi:hypothetical protein
MWSTGREFSSTALSNLMPLVIVPAIKNKLAHNYYGRKDLWDSKIVFRCKQTKVGVVHALPVIECCGLYAKHKQNKVDQRYDLSTSMSNIAVLVTLLLVFVIL